VVECLDRYSWPGNVRELRNAIERAVLLCGGEIVLPDHLPARVRISGAESGALSHSAPKSLQEIELQAIAEMLRKHDYNRTETAKALGISRRALTYKLQQLVGSGYQIDPQPAD
jgi:DNA-binding NtrC family response regulator